jgi:hypothetical protein
MCNKMQMENTKERVRKPSHSYSQIESFEFHIVQFSQSNLKFTKLNNIPRGIQKSDIRTFQGKRQYSQQISTETKLKTDGILN